MKYLGIDLIGKRFIHQKLRNIEWRNQIRQVNGKTSYFLDWEAYIVRCPILHKMSYRFSKIHNKVKSSAQQRTCQQNEKETYGMGEKICNPSIKQGVIIQTVWGTHTTQWQKTQRIQFRNM